MTSNSRHRYAGHGFEEDLSSPRAAQPQFNQPDQPVLEQQQQHPPHRLRPSQSNSTLADSIRALRDQKSSAVSRPYSPSVSPLPNEPLANRRIPSRPSQLHQDTSPAGNTKLYLREGLHSPLSPNSASSLALPTFANLPSTPKERLDALFSPVSGSPRTGSPTTLVVSPKKAYDGAILRQPRSHGQLRNPPLPTTLSRTGPSPPLSPTTAIASRPGIGTVMPRNSSIDSSVSSISSNTSQIPRSNTSLSTSKAAGENDADFDPASFVAQLGSVEAALYQLWKEKQNSAAHNAQLWKFVEKQRSMLLGLQKDLDKACKERERYRKRLKDHLLQCSSGPSGVPSHAGTTMAHRSYAPSPAPSEPVSELSAKILGVQSDPSPITDIQSQGSSKNPSPKYTSVHTATRASQVAAVQVPAKPVSPAETMQANDNTALEEDKRRTAIQVSYKSPQSPVSPLGSASDHISAEVSPVTSTSAHADHSLERMETPLTESSVITETSPTDKDATATKYEAYKPTGISIIAAKVSPPPVMTPPNPPKLALTNPTPTVDAGSFPSPPKPSLGSRKAVPAPLNLAQSNLSPPHDQTGFSNQSPIYAIRGGEHVPDIVDRGRRRTRHDDDRIREAVAQKEEEVRSLSKKNKSKSKSAGTTPVASPTITTGPQPVVQQSITSITAAPYSQTIPSSPRLQINPSSLLSPAGSEGSMASMTAQRSSIVAPLLSPGLPMSPRPGHRPANSPAPRHPKQDISSSSSNAAGSPLMGLVPSPSSPVTNSVQSDHSSWSVPPVQAVQAIQAVEAAQRIAPEHLADQSKLNSPSAMPAPLFFKKAEAQMSAVDAPQREAPQREAPQPPIAVSRPSLAPPRSASIDKVVGTDRVFRGLVSEQYPGLLLPPNALPFIEVRVFSSRLRPSRHSILLSLEEDPVFLLGIYSRSDGKQLWRVEKTSQALPSLHAQIKSLCPFDGRLPDGSLFQGHAPATIDARRSALNQYFTMLLDTPLSEDAALVICYFFSTDVMDPEPEIATLKPTIQPETGIISNPDVRPLRQGYLTKRGKNFGGWKARYFVLDGPELKYFDSQGGPQVGVIKLHSSQIGKQSSKSNESPMGRGGEENQYRHAFLILEPKKKDSASLVRHVLCAESDEERDAWVEACMAYVDVAAGKKSRQSTAAPGHRQTATPPTVHPNLVPAPLQPPQVQASGEDLRMESLIEQNTPTSTHSSNKDAHEPRPSHPDNVLLPRPNDDSQSRSQSRLDNAPMQTVGMSYESTVQAEAPTFGHTAFQNRNSPSPSVNSFPKNNPLAQKEVTISGPTNGARIQDMGAWGLKTPAREKKRSIFGFASRGRSSSDSNTPQLAKEGSPARGPSERTQILRNIFGMPLAEAVEVAPPEGVDAYVPAVIYRSIEYLRANSAQNEEGIFRLSGSNVTIKALRERFTQEGDVNLVEGEYYDVHAVASLLKLYLRELPNSILTRDLHMDFLGINKLDDHQKKVAAANFLVHKLPKANYFTLEALCSFLIEVVGNADRNKMNVRNVGIVFAPTLNVAAWLISLFLTDFNSIFGDGISEEQSPIREMHAMAPQQTEPLRSPRHQLFSDLSTPTHNQSSFSAMPGFQALPQQQMPGKQVQPQQMPAKSIQPPQMPANPVQPQRNTYMSYGPPVQPYQGQQTLPHNEWAGPEHMQYPQQQQPYSQHQQYSQQQQANHQQANHQQANHQQANQQANHQQPNHHPPSHQQQYNHQQQQQYDQQQQQYNQQYQQQYQRQPQSYHPSFPHPSMPHGTQVGMPDGYPQVNNVRGMSGQHLQTGASDARRNRRESAMMGTDIGLVGQRAPPRQTLKDTNSSGPAPSSIY